MAQDNDQSNKFIQLPIKNEIDYDLSGKEEDINCETAEPNSVNNFHNVINKKFDISRKETDLIANNSKTEKLYKCSKCDYRCHQKSDLTSHKTVHSLNKTYKCFHCDYETVYRRNMISHCRFMHSETHLTEKPFKCSKCCFQTLRKCSLTAHLLRHSSGNDADYKCTVCDINFKRKSKKMSGEQDKPYTCSKCDFSTKRLICLENHLTRHNVTKPVCYKISLLEKKVDLYKCRICQYVGADNFSLRLHRLHYCENKEKPYKCLQCSFITAKEVNLNTHIRKQHSGDKIFYQCSICDFSTISKGLLLSHERKHDGKKPYKCSECDYRTNKNRTLINHQKVHLYKTTFKCLYCDFATLSKSLLMRHLQMHLNGKESTGNIKSENSEVKMEIKNTDYGLTACVDNDYSSIEDGGMLEDIKEELIEDDIIVTVNT